MLPRNLSYVIVLLYVDVLKMSFVQIKRLEFLNFGRLG